MKKNKHQKHTATPAGAILLGGAICIFSFLAVMLLAAMLILTTNNPLLYSDTFSPLAFALSGALAGLIGRKALKEGRMFLFCPPLVLLLALLAGLLLSGGRIALSALLSELIFLGAAYLAFFLSKGRGTKRKHRH